MSVRQSNASSATTTMVPNAAAPAPMVDVTEASQETALAEGNNYNVVAQEAPLKRNVVVSIKSTLNGEADLYGLNFYSFPRLSSSCFIEFRFHTHLYTRRPLPPAPARHLVAVRRGPPRHLPVRVPSSVSNSTFVYECMRLSVCMLTFGVCACDLLLSQKATQVHIARWRRRGAG